VGKNDARSQYKLSGKFKFWRVSHENFYSPFFGDAKTPGLLHTHPRFAHETNSPTHFQKKGHTEHQKPRPGDHLRYKLGIPPHSAPTLQQIIMSLKVYGHPLSPCTQVSRLSGGANCSVSGLRFSRRELRLKMKKLILLLESIRNRNTRNFSPLELSLQLMMMGTFFTASSLVLPSNCRIPCNCSVPRSQI
jgi:hypothetical protein